MITITRGKSTDDGTFGELVAGDFRCITLELPWRDNLPFKSCIPGGEYVAVPHHSARYGNTWCIVNERLGVFQRDIGVGRYAILIHPSNTIKDLMGCIAVGSTIGEIGGKPAVLNSRKTFSQLFAALDGADAHYVRILWGGTK